MRHIYSVLIFILLPLIFFKLWRGGKNIPGSKNRWQERIGRLPENILLPSSKKDFDKDIVNDTGEFKPTLWIHAASVGEFIAARPLIEHYLNSKQWRLFITTMTATGSAEVLKHYQGKVRHSFAPCDLGWFIKPFLRKLQPSAFLVIETELWPNTLHHCNKNSIPTILINARLSEKSARGYQKFSTLSKSMLDNINHVIAQGTNDAQRFYGLGLAKEKSSVSGTIKFDLEINTQTKQQAKALKNTLSEHKKYTLLIAASTHQSEDESILKAFRLLKKTRDDIRLIIVPRHPERFDTVFSLCKKSGFKTIRRSEHIENYPADTDILLGDTMGELLTMLGAADITFIGGSFINNGGHNYIEAAAWGVPILSGPSRFNFQDISDLLIKEHALTIVENAEELSLEWAKLINDNKLREERGLASKRVAKENRGALKKTVQIINDIIKLETSNNSTQNNQS